MNRILRKLLPCILLLIILLNACETTAPEVIDEKIPAAEVQPPEKTEPEPLPPPKEEPKTGGLSITFTAWEGGDTVPVHCRIFPQGSPESPAAEGTGETAVFTLPPGNYSLTAEWETGSKAFQGLSVAAGRLTKRALSLDAGTLTIRFTDTPGGGAADTAWRLYKGGSRDTPLAEGSGAAPAFLLSEGLYDLFLQQTEAWTEGLSVGPGTQTERTIVLSRGTLTVEFLDPDEGPAWAEYRIHPPGDWETILLWDSGGGFTEYLEEGVYDLYYAWDGGESWIRNIRLAPGSLVEQTILLVEG